MPSTLLSTPTRALQCLVVAILALHCIACGPGTSDTPVPAEPPSAPDATPTEARAADEVPREADWAGELAALVEAIDESMPGRLGVHVRRLSDASRFDRGSERRWYLASTIKVPVAIAVLEQVEAGEVSLDQRLVLQESDFVDGAGDLIWQDPGGEISVGELIGKSIRDSDSTATDMLIRLVGEDQLNRRVREWTGGGLNDITTILQVRYDVYGPTHRGVPELSNMDIVRLRNADAGEPRLQALANALGVARGELDAEDFDAVFARYYEGGLNSGLLHGFGDLLASLEQGELLDQAHTDLVLGHMSAITTGDRRIAAGLPVGTPFAQKTGTQIARACNVGILHPGEDRAVVVAACAEEFGDVAQAEQAFQALGRALAQVGLLD